MATASAEAPERRCLVTRDEAPKAGLIRFVVGPEGSVVPDILGRLPGRGMYLSARGDVLETAATKNPFSRAAKTQVTVAPDMPSQVEALIARRVVELVSLARKAGFAICGYEKVKSWLADDRVKLLLQASDGSQRGKGKLWTPEGARWFGILTADELGLAFGRQNVIHAALSGGGLTKRVIEEAARLKGLRETPGRESRAKG